jgi:hypothetical protein
MPRIYAAIGAELETLWATGFEVMADLGPYFVDPAGVRFAPGAMVRASPIRAHPKCLLAEVSGFELGEYVCPPDPFPAHEVGV